MNLIEELEYRGLIHTILGGTKEMLLKEPTTFYLGTDGTGSSLHVGHYQAFVVAKLLQKYGHKPIILVGKFTASLGDPSGRTTERQLLSLEQIDENCKSLAKQISRIIDFDSDAPNKAILVNNYDWFGKMSLFDFARDICKHITVNYMLSKDSVQQRISREGCGISLTEFLYSPMQSYDFLHLYQNYGCKIQIGGSDQWGNITSGTELIRKKIGKTDVGAFVFPLVTRADGTKFGKSASGTNIWLDPNRTSPFEFYQFWFNQSDEDAKNLIKRFTLLEKDEIEDLIKQHEAQPSLRILQKALAKEVTIMVHGEEAYENAVNSTNAIFGNGTSDDLKKMSSKDIESVFNGVSKYNVNRETLTNNNGIKFIDLCVEKATAFKSKGELRKLIQNGGIFLNKEKVKDINLTVNESNLIADKYLILRQGKKTYSLIVVE